jgi:hypothetical protein
MQGAARRESHRQEKATSDTASSAASTTSMSERNRRYSDWHGGQDVDKETNPAVIVASSCFDRSPLPPETGDTAIYAAGKPSRSESNKQCSDCNLTCERKKRGSWRAARRARCQQVKEISNVTSGAAGKPSTRERNKRNERHGGQTIDRGKKRAIRRVVRRARRRRVKVTDATTSSAAGKPSTTESTKECSEWRDG